jgi:hypothetical protein
MQTTLRKDQKGQAAIFLTLSLPVTFGMLAMVVDLGWCYFRAEACKTAAQSAAIAAAMAARNAPNLTCGSGVTCTADASTYVACPSNPTSPPSSNLQSGCLYAMQNGFTYSGSSGRQNVRYAASTTGSPISGSSPNYWVRFVVSENIPTLFAGILRQPWQVVSAAATAAVFRPGGGACVYALDPTAAGAITIKGNADVEASCGVWDNSSSSSSLSCTNNTTLNAGSANITLTGGNDCSGTVTPTPLTYQASTADPFASVPTPADRNRCDANGINAGDSITMPLDGTFEVCGDISLTGNGSTSLPAGIYYVKNGNLAWHNGSITGSGVTIFMTGNSPGTITINGNMTVNLAAPTSGTYHGLVIYQDRTLTSPPNHTFNGGAGMNFRGSIYLPGSALKYAGGNSSSVTALIADTIVFTGGAYFHADPNGAVTGIGAPTASMIE